ncbi:MAG: DUF2142 domain-containing protein [Lachnospiraceae bacterium]|nr:DUF2142 domain-containing protein [Lachnospiraceae bacterium]
MKNFLKQYKIQTVIGYILLCLLYMIIQIVRTRSEQYVGFYSIKGIVMHTLIFLCIGAVLYPVLFVERIKGTAEPAFGVLHLLKPIIALWEKYKQWFGVILVFLTVAACMVYVYRTDIRSSMNTTEDVNIAAVGGGKLRLTDNIQEIQQEFVTTSQKLIGISPAFYMENEEADRTGVIEAVVYEGSRREIARTTIDVSEISNGFYWKIIFLQTELSANEKQYTLVLKFPKNISKYKMSLATADKTKVRALINDTEQAKYSLALKGHVSLNHFVRIYFLMLCGVLVVFCPLFYYLLVMKKISMSWCAFCSILVVGGVYGFLLTPYMVPDEETHIDMAYRYADILMQTGNTDDGHCLKRVEDAEKRMVSDPAIENYRYVYDNFAKLAANEEIIDADATANSGAYLFMHFPGALGIVLARMFHLGYVPMLYLGRFMGLLVFALAVFLGMRKLPFGHATLFVLSMLPITLQQVNSFSYDSILCSAVLLFTCYVLHMAYGEKELQPLDLVIACILGIAIIYCKSGAYTPIVFAFLLIPMSKFATKGAYLSCMGGMTGTFLLGFLVKNVEVVNTGAEVTNKVMGIESAMSIPNYSLSYLLQNPVVLFDVLNNTIADKTEFYVQSMLGQHLGWIQIELSNVLVLAFVIILMMSAFRARGEKQYVTTGNKWWIFIITCASALLVLLGMLVSWTPITYVSVEGVQGRYFFPGLMLGLLMLRNSKIIFDKNADRVVMFAGFATTVLAAFCFMHVVL